MITPKLTAKTKPVGGFVVEVKNLIWIVKENVRVFLCVVSIVEESKGRLLR